MSIKYKKVKQKIRFKESDDNEVQYSDYEIKEAVNEVLRFLSINHAMTNSDFLDRGLTYDQASMQRFTGERVDFCICGAELPEDFMSITAVKRVRDGVQLHSCATVDTPNHMQYKVMGNRIYCGEPCFQLFYKGAIEEVVDEDDEIQLPYFFIDTLVKLSRMVLTQVDGDIMNSAIDEAVERLVPKRKYSHASIKLPFKI